MIHEIVIVRIFLLHVCLYVCMNAQNISYKRRKKALGKLEGRTNIFIKRPFDFKIVDLLLTNFHLPRSTLLVMLDAFLGERWQSLYREALYENYRFLSFGDAMLVQRQFLGNYAGH